MNAGAEAVVSRKRRDVMRQGSAEGWRERKERFNEEKRKEKCIRLHIDTKISRVATTMVLRLSSIE